MTHRNKVQRSVLAVMAVLCLMGVARNANAVERKGLVGGFGIGTGKVTCDDCIAGADLAAEGHIGLMVKSRLALVLEISAVAANDDSAEFFGVAAQYWASPKLWVRGGLGGGTYVSARGESDPGLGFVGALGLDIVQKQWSAIHLQARFSTSKIQGARHNSVSALVGFSFFLGSR